MTARTYGDVAVEVCPICDIAGCRHIRERQANPARTYTAAEVQAIARRAWEAGRDAGARALGNSRETATLQAWEAIYGGVTAIRALTPPDMGDIIKETGDE